MTSSKMAAKMAAFLDFSNIFFLRENAEIENIFY